MPTTDLAWHWAVGANGCNCTRAGIVAATRGPNIVTVHGVLATRHLRLLECSFDGGATWAAARDPTAIPESNHDKFSFSDRYKHKWPMAHGDIEPDTGLIGARFSCAIGMAAVPRLLSVRVSSDEWRIDGVAIHQPGYPIVSGDDEAGSSSSGSSSSADVTVCVQYVYGTGYTSRTLQEFAAWYLLLGAKRIVVFDSMEPSLEPTAEQPTAMERKEALHSLSVALGRRFVVVRGLAVWDMMRRTRSHMSGQSLAGNLCKSAAGALAHGSRPTFALMPDIDEYLTPPTSDADQPHRLATRLAGSLKRLAAHVHGGLSATSLYLNDPSTVASRVHHGGGTTRCLSFASIYYVLPACKDIEEDPARLGLSRPAILRRLWRGQPDNFEAGPSYNWTSFVHWNFFVRSKFLVDATDDNVLTANHECCCKPESRGKAQCSTRAGLTVNHTCATLEFMPLEHWHVRHFKGGGLGKDPMLCRHTVTMNAIQSIDGTRKHVTLQPTEVGFPLPWANEYLSSLRNLTRRLGGANDSWHL